MHDRRWFDILFNSTDYVAERLKSYAQRLRALAWGKTAETDVKLLRLDDPVILVDRQDLRDALDAVGAGTADLPVVLASAIAQVFGCYPVPQSGKVDVKISTWILNQHFERDENITTRFRLFAARYDWLTQVGASFEDNSDELRTVRADMRRQHEVELFAAKVSRCVNEDDAAAVRQLDLEAVADAAVAILTSSKESTTLQRTRRDRSHLSDDQIETLRRMTEAKKSNVVPFASLETGSCSCCQKTQIVSCTLATSSSTDACACVMYYYCYHVHSMSRQATLEATTCPACDAPTCGVFLENPDVSRRY